jgi:RNA polymerase subunit RPABC4/transcription elongation factor Spt4
MSPQRDAAAPDERVRFCLRCGAMVEFDERTCPACGHAEPLPGDVALVACTGCERVRAATLQFCPECGREAEGVWPPPPAVPAQTPAPAGPLISFSVLLAWLAPLAAILALALALRSR